MAKDIVEKPAKDLYMLGVNIAKADNLSDAPYQKIQEAIIKGIIYKKHYIRIYCTLYHDPKKMLGAFICNVKENSNFQDEISVSIAFNSGYYDLSNAKDEEKDSFMNGAMLKFGKLVFNQYNMKFSIHINENENLYYIESDLNDKSRGKFNFER